MELRKVNEKEKAKIKRWIVVGDIHGHDSWKKKLAHLHHIHNHHIEDIDVKKIIFLGDYVDSFGVSIDKQISNLLDILKYKEINPNVVVLLLGNHDYHYWQDDCQYSGWNRSTKTQTQSIYIDQINRNMIQMIYNENIGGHEFVFSHAGVTNTWLNEVAEYQGDYDDGSVLNCEGYSVFNQKADFINIIMKTNPKVFDWNSIGGSSPTGNTVTNSPIWVRPVSLLKDNIKGINQIIGHTYIKPDYPAQYTYGRLESDDLIEICDCGGLLTIIDLINDKDIRIWKA